MVSKKKKLYPKKPAAKFLVCFELLRSPYLMVIGDFPRKIFLDTMTEGHVCCLLLFDVFVDPTNFGLFGANHAKFPPSRPRSNCTIKTRVGGGVASS